MLLATWGERNANGRTTERSSRPRKLFTEGPRTLSYYTNPFRKTIPISNAGETASGMTCACLTHSSPPFWAMKPVQDEGHEVEDPAHDAMPPAVWSLRRRLRHELHGPLHPADQLLV